MRPAFRIYLLAASARKRAKTSPKCYGDVMTARSRHFPDDEALLPLIKGRVEEGRATGIVLGVLDANGTRRILAYVDAVCGQGGS